jgi:hypothetical protein
VTLRQLTRIGTIAANQGTLVGFPAEKRSITIDYFRNGALRHDHAALAGSPAGVMMATTELSYQPISRIASRQRTVTVCVCFINGFLIEVLMNDPDGPFVQFLLKLPDCCPKLLDVLIPLGQRITILFGEQLGVMLPLFEMILVAAFDVGGTIPQVSGADPANSHFSRKPIWHPRWGKIRIWTTAASAMSHAC